MLDVRDENGRTVIVPVAFNAKGRHATINLVKTAFGRENDLWFPLQEQQDLLVYANQEKINRWNESSGPKSLWGSNDSEISVLIEKDHVNEKLKYAGMYQGARGSFNPALNQITLTPNANISTYSHEMAHRYLSNLFELSKRAGAESTLKEDAQTLLKEFSIKSVEDWGTSLVLKVNASFKSNLPLGLRFTWPRDALRSLRCRVFLSQLVC